jgi:hypothetical protein
MRDVVLALASFPIWVLLAPVFALGWLLLRLLG